MNQEKLEKFRATAMRTLRILDRIARGDRHAATIAEKTKTSRQVVEYYLKQLNKE